MEYSNPEIPEGINTSKQHPLKDFFLLTTAVFGGIIIIGFILALMVEKLALHIPFSVEQELIEKIEFNEDLKSDPEIQTYLDQLTLNLLPLMNLPEDMTVKVNYIDEPTENAFASIGGQISIYRGLIDLLPNENSLAMVIAHEIAHIKHRDPIVALGRGVVVGLFLSVIAGVNTDRFVSNIITDTGTLTLLSFNRNQEQKADTVALEALVGYYGHVNGADSLFKAFIKLDELELHSPEFFNTHPLSENRIDNIHKAALINNWATDGDLTQLPVLLGK
jgi:predicted Zn-dependent protease